MKRESPTKTDRLLFHLVRCTFEVVERSADRDVLEGLFHSYGYNSAIAFSNNFAYRMDGFSPSEKIVAAWMWGNHAFTSAAFKYLAVEDEAILVNKGCPFRSQVPAICRLVCTHMAKPMADLRWPDCFFRQTPRAEEDDDLCIWIAGSEEADPGRPDFSVLIDAEEMLGRISNEESLWLHSHILGELWSIGVSNAVDLLGEEQARESLVAAAIKEGELLACEESKCENHETGNINAVHALHELAREAGLNGELGSTPSGVQVFIVEDCPLQGNHPIACLQVEALLDSFIRSLDDSFSYQYQKKAVDGRRCIAALGRSTAPEKKEPSPRDSEPLQILLLRLARGEISIEEYKVLKSYVERESASYHR